MSRLDMYSSSIAATAQSGAAVVAPLTHAAAHTYGLYHDVNGVCVLWHNEQTAAAAAADAATASREQGDERSQRRGSYTERGDVVVLHENQPVAVMKRATVKPRVVPDR